MFVKEFWVEAVVAGLLLATILTSLKNAKKWFVLDGKKEAERERERLTERLFLLRAKMSLKRTNKKLCFSQIQGTQDQIAKKTAEIRNSWLGIVVPAIAAVFLGVLGFVLYKHSDAKGEKDSLAIAPTVIGTVSGIEGGVSQTPTNTLSPTCTTTPTLVPTATNTPIPTLTPIPTYIPLPTLGPSFVEEGKTVYGDLTEYLGMTAGELIKKIDKPYKYEYRGQNMETGVTGGLWFDEDVLFAFCDSEKTLDMSCEVYMVWVGSDFGIAKNIGSGLVATMSGDDYEDKLGPFYSGAYENMLVGGVSAGARCGDYRYSFFWSEEFADFDSAKPPKLIYIYKSFKSEE